MRERDKTSPSIVYIRHIGSLVKASNGARYVCGGEFGRLTRWLARWP